MPFSLLWLPGVLRAAGLQVEEVPGWQNHGHGDEGQVLGVLCHHTCGPLHGDLPDQNVLVNGRPDLGGPVCNLGLGRSGKFYMIAAGKAWHAGAGAWHGVTDGNAHLIGIEAENTGETTGPKADPWPGVQVDAYVRGCAAILKHIGASSIMAIGHKEWALPHGRKTDPSFDMNAFRARISAAMGEKPSPAQIPPAKPRAGRVISPDDLNVRQAANGAAPVLRTLKPGAGVTVLSASSSGSTTWFAIAGGGYVAAQFVELDPQ